MFKEIYDISGAETYLHQEPCECPPRPDLSPCPIHFNYHLNAEMLAVAVKHIDLMQKAKDHVLQKAYEAEVQVTTDLVDPIKVKLAKHANTLYYWICVTPGDAPLGKKGKYTVQDFAEQVEKFIHRRCCTAGMAVMEQKGTQDKHILGKKYMGSHPHAHLLVRRNINIPVKTFHKNLISSFQRFYKSDKCINRHTLYRMPCPQEIIKDKILYCTDGGKTADGKDKAQAIDKVWRKENNWPDFFLNGQLQPE